ncbi:maleylpyruvate isomerase family mycothiol-dependent enzyme [Lentzea sp. NBRC 105346]|uniref:maleylpyruvate isomerase family mycothiol-dependent enzyme n=1 Tax=Lentzea sp. NBRC 105346 TaxID=3032205 RepID=UPI002556CBD4|nr:maleylpyruvate isomerase family mycothiol-dependent enzyme [Lentzea sp. NBRC 105346]
MDVSGDVVFKVTQLHPYASSMTRDPKLAARLLLAERDELVPILRRMPIEKFDLPTACTGWSVRDVLAHCAAALTRLTEDRVHDFCPKCNQEDIDDRRDHTITDILDELESGYVTAGEALSRSDGRLDVIALGEWVHGGDVREALGEPNAYASAGIDAAITLLTSSNRVLKTPLTRVRTPDQEWLLGTAEPGRETAELIAAVPTFIRLYTGRKAGPNDYRLRGASPEELVIYR